MMNISIIVSLHHSYHFPFSVVLISVVFPYEMNEEFTTEIRTTEKKKK